MAVKQRARRDEDKAVRRLAILDTATVLLQHGAYHDITMAEVARQSGLAKGTLYLYFSSKEALFLAALERELDDWFADVGGLLMQGPLTPETFARGLAGSLTAHPRLLELMSLLHNVLEHNIDVETARGFKTNLLRKMQAASALVQAALPMLRPGTGALLLMRMYALVVGYRQMASAAPNVAEALQSEALAPLRVDFEADFAAALVDLICGMTRA